MEKILSICIPVYNGGKIAYQHIKEILAYKNNDIEIIVSDNASTDNTLDLLMDIKDERIKIVTHEKNVGPFWNWYHVLMAGTAKYVMLHQDNDKIIVKNLPQYLNFLKEVQYDVMRNVNACMKSREVTVAQAQYFNMLYSHAGYVVYRREALHSIKPLKCSFDFRWVSYPYLVWDTQILRKYPLKEKRVYINCDIKINYSPKSYGDKASRGKAFGDSLFFSLELPYTYESVINRFIKYIQILRHLYPKDKEYSKLLCNAYRVNLRKAVIQFYIIMNNPQERWMKHRYGLDALDCKEIDYLELNNDFLKTTILRLNMSSPIWRLITILELKIITIYNSSDYILNYCKKKNEVKYRKTGLLLNKILDVIINRMCK